MGRIIDSLNARMPQYLNKTSPEYQAIFGRTTYTPNDPITESSDYNCGAVANELEYLRGYVGRLVDSLDVSKAEGLYLEKIIYFMLFLERIVGEEDETLRDRFYAMVRRQGNLRWCTTWSIRDVFSYFFSSESIYVLENYIETSLASNGDFELGSGNTFTDWSAGESGASVIVEETSDVFDKARACRFNIDASNSAADVAQTISGLTAGSYRVSLFYTDDGLCPDADVAYVELQRSGDSYYYDFVNDTWVASSSADTKKYLAKSSAWTYGATYFSLTDTRDVTAAIHNQDKTSGTAYSLIIDHFALGEWRDYPSVKVLIVTQGTAGGYASLFPAGADPLGGGEDYVNASFFDQDYVQGAGGFYTEAAYEDILARVKEAGSKSEVEFVERT